MNTNNNQQNSNEIYRNSKSQALKNTQQTIDTSESKLNPQLQQQLECTEGLHNQLKNITLKPSNGIIYDLQ